MRRSPRNSSALRSGVDKVGLADRRGDPERDRTEVVDGLGASARVRRSATASHLDMVQGLLAEGRAVAAAQGIVLDTDQQEFDDAIARAYFHRPRMLQDVAAHCRTEVDVLNGGVRRSERD